MSLVETVIFIEIKSSCALKKKEKHTNRKTKEKKPGVSTQCAFHAIQLGFEGQYKNTILTLNV